MPRPAMPPPTIRMDSPDEGYLWIGSTLLNVFGTVGRSGYWSNWQKRNPD
jgi:hypothetical protein